MRLLIIILPCLLLGACFTTRLEAPPGKQVRIMAQGERATFRKEYKDWYLLSGLLPIWRTNMADIIAKENLAEVRVQTEDRVADGVITVLTEELLLGLYPQSIVIEGNATSPGSILIEDTTKRPSQPQHQRLVNQAPTTASTMTGGPSGGIPMAAPLP